MMKEDDPSPARENAEVLAAVQETLNGDTSAFRIVVDRYTPLLFSLSLRMLGGREDAEEAVQEIFLKVFASLRSFKLEKRFLPWIYTIALNHLRTSFKKRSRRRRVETVLPHEDLAARPGDGDRVGPEHRLFLAQAEAAAGRALLRIRHEYRAVFILRALEGLSVSEIATIMGIPEGTVKTFFRRARQNLAELIFRETRETPDGIGSI
ncbi:MAG: RNA polymerase sigma factor [Spirochaetales bacterium]|nr:RNA polymerase sigma factor [Spirochaetales bacterium]